MIYLPPEEEVKILAWAQRDIERRVRNVVATLKTNAPHDTGALRDSIQVDGTDILGLQYGLYIDKKHPWIAPALK